MRFDAEFSLDAQNLLSPQVITASGAGTDTPQTIYIVGRARAFVFVGALSADTVFTAKIQHSDSDQGPWEDVPGAQFAPVSVANRGAFLGLDTAVAKKYVRLNYTAEGGTPDLIASACFFGERKRIN